MRYQHLLTKVNARRLYSLNAQFRMISAEITGRENSMDECMMVLAYLPWMRFHAHRALRKTLQRTRKGRAHRPNHQSVTRGHGSAVLSQ